MAVVKWTALVTAMKGKLRGSVLQFGAGGQVLRSNKSYNQFSNMRWNLSKNNLGVVTGNWKSLTPSDRTAWAAQTVNYPTKDRYGNTHYPSPYTLHMRLNNAMLYHTNTLLTTPLGPVAFTNVSPITVNLILGNNLQLVINSLTTADELVLLAATPPISPGRRPPNGLYRQIAKPDMSASNTYVFTTDYINRYGQIPAGAQIYVSVRIFNKNTGQISPVLITNVFT